ncbi:hypothetical protein GWK47_035624 [Chionoecetes opilio]|uniref:Uncharacterized protein n=1 Tax=Chionoecetes opilio TaxID=41210 RepID=A0A8J4YHZ6_CHIOP|nr:hypothetical protein GWK47_035624 [Chionoecetes opilio]
MIAAVAGGTQGGQWPASPSCSRRQGRKHEQLGEAGTLARPRSPATAAIMDRRATPRRLVYATGTSSRRSPDDFFQIRAGWRFHVAPHTTSPHYMHTTPTSLKPCFKRWNLGGGTSCVGTDSRSTRCCVLHGQATGSSPRLTSHFKQSRRSPAQNPAGRN